MKIVVPERYDGLSAAHFLQQALGFSPLQCKKIRLHGSLESEGRLQRMKDPVRGGATLHLKDPASVSGKTPVLRPEGRDYLIYHDDWFVVASKPAGMLSHTNFHDPNPALNEILAIPPLRAVQRLDRDTSGLMLLALHAHAAYRLSQGTLVRRYLAFVHGLPLQTSGVIDRPIERQPGSSIERRISPTGQRAISEWRCLKRWPEHEISLLELRLITGRTHQLRLHCLSMGWPLVGETLYTGERCDLAGLPEPIKPKPFIGYVMPRQALHAWRLSLYHPDVMDPRAMSFEAVMPEDMQQLGQALDQGGL